jgi:hypothetical protein
MVMGDHMLVAGCLNDILTIQILLRFRHHRVLVRVR